MGGTKTIERYVSSHVSSIERQQVLPTCMPERGLIRPLRDTYRTPENTWTTTSNKRSNTRPRGDRRSPVLTLALIMSAVGKRKRDEYETSDDDDEHVLGKQVLPVANLPFDFDGVPEDGAQYLFTVRYVRILGLENQTPLALTGRCLVDVMQVCFLISQGLTIRMQYQKRQ